MLLSLLLLAGIGSALSASSDSKPTIAENTVLKLDLNQSIREQAPGQDPFLKNIESWAK